MQRKNYIEKRVLVLDLTSLPSGGDGSGHCCWVHAWVSIESSYYCLHILSSCYMEKRLKVFVTTCPNQLNVELDKWALYRAAKLLLLHLPLRVAATAAAAAVV